MLASNLVGIFSRCRARSGEKLDSIPDLRKPQNGLVYPGISPRKNGNSPGTFQSKGHLRRNEDVVAGSVMRGL